MELEAAVDVPFEDLALGLMNAEHAYLAEDHPLAIASRILIVGTTTMLVLSGDSAISLHFQGSFSKTSSLIEDFLTCIAT